MSNKENSNFQSQADISFVCDEIKSLLLQKNMKYGDAALNPVRIFSRSDAIEQLNVRIDDKLSRISNQDPGEDEDPELDLIGYLILKRVKDIQNKRQLDNGQADRV